MDSSFFLYIIQRELEIRHNLKTPGSSDNCENHVLSVLRYT
jgi:hypothetical protein